MPAVGVALLTRAAKPGCRGVPDRPVRLTRAGYRAGRHPCNMRPAYSHPIGYEEEGRADQFQPGRAEDDRAPAHHVRQRTVTSKVVSRGSA